MRVSAVGDYCTDEVAEHTIALITGLLRGIPFAVAATRGGSWDYRSAAPVRRIAGARLAVVGYGHIGRAVAERGRALGMEVRYHDPFQDGGEPVLDPLLEWADVVTLHLALSERTARIIDGRRLALMRPGQRAGQYRPRSAGRPRGDACRHPHSRRASTTCGRSRRGPTCWPPTTS